MVGIGESISDTLEIEYVTAGILLPRTYETITGSIRVRCVHTNRKPPLLVVVVLVVVEGGVGGLPFTITRPPKIAVM